MPLHGRVVDTQGVPVPRATIVGVCAGSRCFFPAGIFPAGVANAHGDFQLSFQNHAATPGQTATLLVRLSDQREFEIPVEPAADGAVKVQLPVALGDQRPVRIEAKGPADVAPDELAGVVVDPDGKPIEGVEVRAWYWVPGHTTHTDKAGAFRLGKLDKNEAEVARFQKEGYADLVTADNTTGKPGWVVTMSGSTAFEGTVTTPDGNPAAGALVRGNNGPNRLPSIYLPEIWTEVRSDAQGHYKLRVQPDAYEVVVRAPGVGVARLPGTVISADETKHLDIKLQPGVTFRANVVDADSGKPVAGLHLASWNQPGIEGRSDKDGLLTISDLMPGAFEFRKVDCPGYAQWWSEDGEEGVNRRRFDPGYGGWQRNYGELSFKMKPGMGLVTISVERAVTIHGRVLDPDGKPVAGATAAPALTGTGNSLTGDTRFSVETGADGRFTMHLPASGKRDYNLMAHDGKYSQWRTWANGVLPPIHTKPGQVIDDVVLTLTRPAIVRGRVTDAAGRPVASREVRASAADRMENRYYDPTTRTTADGAYELKFIRPGEQFIQVAPFWLDARQGPTRSSQTLVLKAGEVKEGVDFRVAGDAR